MRLIICAVGRLRGGPEHALIQDYQTRFDRVGRTLGLGPLTIREVEDKRSGGKTAEADLLAAACPKAAVVICLDEQGEMLSSPDFAAKLSVFRDQGVGELAFVIGGADGLAPKIIDQAQMRLSFGPMVWPHMLARVMLTEQLYRAASILASLPYHRA